jgi:hypothetical protein
MFRRYYLAIFRELTPVQFCTTDIAAFSMYAGCDIFDFCAFLRKFGVKWLKMGR